MHAASPRLRPLGSRRALAARPTGSKSPALCRRAQPQRRAPARNAALPPRAGTSPGQGNADEVQITAELVSQDDGMSPPRGTAQRLAAALLSAAAAGSMMGGVAHAELATEVSGPGVRRRGALRLQVERAASPRARFCAARRAGWRG